jgi:hypothetical protein
MICFLAYVNNYNHYVSYYNTYQHGGISLEEMIIPALVFNQIVSSIKALFSEFSKY